MQHMRFLGRPAPSGMLLLRYWSLWAAFASMFPAAAAAAVFHPSELATHG